MCLSEVTKLGWAAPPRTRPPKPVTAAQAGGRGQDLSLHTVRPATGPGGREDPENNKFVYVYEIAAACVAGTGPGGSEHPESAKFVYVYEIAAAPGMGTAGWRQAPTAPALTLWQILAHRLSGPRPAPEPIPRPDELGVRLRLHQGPMP